MKKTSGTKRVAVYLRVGTREQLDKNSKQSKEGGK